MASLGLFPLIASLLSAALSPAKPRFEAMARTRDHEMAQGEQPCFLRSDIEQWRHETQEKFGAMVHDNVSEEQVLWMWIDGGIEKAQNRRECEALKRFEEILLFLDPDNATALAWRGALKRIRNDETSIKDLEAALKSRSAGPASDRIATFSIWAYRMTQTPVTDEAEIDRFIDAAPWDPGDEVGGLLLVVWNELRPNSSVTRLAKIYEDFLKTYTPESELAQTLTAYRDHRSGRQKSALAIAKKLLPLHPFNSIARHIVNEALFKQGEISADDFQRYEEQNGWRDDPRALLFLPLGEIFFPRGG